MRVLIAGCGYVGVALGKALSEQGHLVFGVRRSRNVFPMLEQAGIGPLAADICDRSQVEALPGPFDAIVHLASSSKGGVPEYRQIYLEAMRNLIASFPQVRRFLYTSSTSVYGQTDGSEVSESSPVIPATETSRVLVEAEEILKTAFEGNGFPCIILRVGGIYGPGRGHLLRQYLAGDARITGTGQRHLNMIHLDDVVGMIATALARSNPGEIYNAVDNEPVAEIDFYRWLSQRLQSPLPPLADAAVHGRKRALTDKRVSNFKIRQALGYVLKYPTFREGYAAELAGDGLRTSGCS